MAFRNSTTLKRETIAAIAFASFTLALTASAPRVLAEQPVTTLAALLDRAQIEDMLVDYYHVLSGGAGPDLGSFYLDDAVLDVNGIVRSGRQPINDLYKTIHENGKVHVLLTNLKIVTHGDSATADLIWTEFLSKTHAALPRVVEQGREHDELLKQNGRWLIKKRVVTNDGGLPASLEKFYKER